jgi:hypothetical protein
MNSLSRRKDWCSKIKGKKNKWIFYIN